MRSQTAPLPSSRDVVLVSSGVIMLCLDKCINSMAEGHLVQTAELRFPALLVTLKQKFNHKQKRKLKSKHFDSIACCQDSVVTNSFRSPSHIVVDFFS